MDPRKKAFKTLYQLICEQKVTFKEAFDIADAVFETEYYPVPVPTVLGDEENPTEKSTDNMGFMVKGFAPLK